MFRYPDYIFLKIHARMMQRREQMGMATWEEPEIRKPHKGCVICPGCSAEFSKATKEWRMGYMINEGTTPGEFHYLKTVKRGDCPMCDTHVFDV